jgi:hypothetical protein
MPFNDPINRAQLSHHIAEHIEEQGLRTIAEGVFGIRMDVDDQSIGADRDAGSRCPDSSRRLWSPITAAPGERSRLPTRYVHRVSEITLTKDVFC